MSLEFMKRAGLLTLLLILVVPGLAEEFGTALSFSFATVEQGKELLAKRDAFVERLSAFDRSARLKTDKAVSEEEFLKHVGDSVLAFTSAETNGVWRAVTQLKPRLQEYQLNWPATVLFIKTSGKEEGNAPYTRGNAIVIPEGKLRQNTDAQVKLLSHELFHILSRHNPALKEALYKVIGFEKCTEVTLPKTWIRITNPDAPVNDHWIAVKRGGKEVRVAPILLASAPTYDMKRGGEFFDYLSFKLIVLEGDGVAGAVTADAKLLDVQEVEGFFEQVGRNTQYIIHPEEILAENFAMLLSDGKKVASPEVLKKMKATLKGG